MIIFCILAFVIFPAAALIPTVRSDGKTALSKDSSAFFKGAAICFVVMSHISIMMGLSEKSVIFSAVDQLGGMGVLIFFFLSGFGLYRAYADKTCYAVYVKKRVINVLVPYLILKAVFLAVEAVLKKEMTASYIAGRFDDWFVDVILIQYLIFLFCWKFLGNRKALMTAVCFIANIILAVVLIALGTNPRWYNALLLFPAGMAVALYEDKIAKAFSGHRILSITVSLILFGTFGALFISAKDSVAGNFLKTAAGIALGFTVFGLSMIWDLRSPVMRYIGTNSLYFYIVHLEIKKILENCFTIDPTVAAVIIISGSAVSVPLISLAHKKIFGKAGS